MDFELLAWCPFPHFRLGSQLLSGGRVFNGAGSEQEFSRARSVKQRDCLPQWLAAPGEWGLGPDSAHHRIWPSRLPGVLKGPRSPTSSALSGSTYLSLSLSLRLSLSLPPLPHPVSPALLNLANPQAVHSQGSPPLIFLAAVGLGLQVQD